jgi:hypothetical protein
LEEDTLIDYWVGDAPHWQLGGWCPHWQLGGWADYWMDDI